MSKKVLGDVHPEKHFWLADGKRLKNVKELKDALLEMHDHTYQHHANEHRNDFHNWVKEVQGDTKLAKMLHAAEDKLKAAEAIETRIGELTRSPITKKKRNINREFQAAEPQEVRLSSRFVSIMAVITLMLVIFFIGIGSYAANISGAAVGTAQAEEIQFLGFAGIVGLFLLFFVVAKARKW
jgi:uncharacterized membrane protein (DUF485 family)